MLGHGKAINNRVREGGRGRYNQGWLEICQMKSLHVNVVCYFACRFRKYVAIKAVCNRSNQLEEFLYTSMTYLAEIVKI